MSNGFRVFDNDENEYVENPEDFFINADGELCRYFCHSYPELAGDGFTIELRTGKKCAETGVMLYEGDIVDFKGYVSRIKWDNYYHRFCRTREHSMGEQLYVFCDNDEYTKVGNIHDE